MPTVHKDTTQAGLQITRDNYHWGATIGAPVTISYGFRTSAATFTVPGHSISQFSMLTAAQQTTARAALGFWSSIANISFTDLGGTNNAAIEFANYRDASDGSQAFAFFPVSGNTAASSSQGDVFINTYYASTSNVGPGTYDFVTFIHEIGHALGLGHPANYNASATGKVTYEGSATYIEDTRQYTVMSYFDEAFTGANFLGTYPETPMLHDIAAIQRLYGVNTSTRTGATVYGFNSNAGSPYSITSSSQRIVFTVWDAGGTDTFDFSGYTQRQTINLNAQSFSSIGGLASNIGIAAGVTIENAVGGSEADTIVGNASDNALRGGLENDTIDGGLGIDTAVFSGLRSAYTLTPLNGNGVRVSGPDGTDTLTNIERLQFNDQTIIWPLGTAADDYADSFSDATAPFGTLSVGSTGIGNLEVAGDRDWFRIQLTAGTTYVLGLQGAQSGGGTLADPYLRLRSPTGTLVAENNDIASGSNLDSQLIYTAATTGFYFLEAGALNDTAPGKYKVSAAISVATDDYADSLADTSAPVGQLVVNNQGSGKIETLGDRDWFRVQLAAGGSYQIDVQGLNAGGGTLEDPYVRVYGSSGALLAENDDIVLGVNRDSQLSYRATTAGTYYIEAGSFDDEYLGTYRIAVSGTAPLDDYADGLGDVSAPIGLTAVNGSTTGNLETTTDRDWFRVNLSAGTTYLLNLRGTETGGGTLEDPYLRVRNGSGTLLSENDDIVLGINRDAQMLFTSTSAGTYYLEAGAFDDNYTGTYTLNVSTVGENSIIGDSLDNVLTGTSGNDRIQGLGGIDYLDGGAGNDALLGGAERDTLVGGPGNDYLDGGIIADRINGYDGNTASYAGSTGGINLNLATGIAQDGMGGVDTLVNINIVDGSNFNDSITGRAGIEFEFFEGGPGNDTIDGGLITDTRLFTDSNRTLYSTASFAVTVDLRASTATGGGGNDSLLNINQAFGSFYNDTLLGSDSALIIETLEGYGGNDILNGRGGFDIVRYNSAGVGINVNLATGVATDGLGGTDTLLNIEGIRGSLYNDILTGGNPANGTGATDGLETFQGNAGNDIINGGGGYDRVDFNFTGGGAVIVTLGGTGNGIAQDGLGGTDTLISIEGVRGSSSNDTLTGSDSGVFESFEGGEGNDNIDGRGGTDRADYYYDPAGVTVSLATGSARDGFGGTDALFNIENVRGTRDFNDRLTGGSGANLLEGIGGDDILSGGGGNDTLDGGAGTDIAVYSGVRSGYQVIRNGSQVTVTDINAADGSEASDTLTAIERLQFSDGTSDLTVNRAPVATPTAATQGVGIGTSVAASSLFSVSDADLDTMTQYRFWDSVAGGGNFRVNGVAKGANQTIDVSATELANTVYTAGPVQGAETLYVQAYDGTAWSEWKSWTEQTQRVGNLGAPVIGGPATRNSGTTQWHQLSTFLTVTDADGDLPVRFTITDNSATAGSGLIYANGVTQAQGATVTVTASSLSGIWVQGGTTTGTNRFTITADDGFTNGLGPAKTLDLVTRLPNRAPVVTPTAVTQGVGVNSTVAASSLFSVSDADLDTMTQYHFWDSGSGGGRFTVNGTTQAAMTTITVNAADFASTLYAGGATQGAETLFVQAFDGTAWSEWKSWTEQTQRTTNVGAPVIGGPATRNSDAGQWHQLSTFLTVTDADGDLPVRFTITDNSATAGSGLLYANGVTQAQGATVTVSASNLFGVWVQGGSTPGTNRFTLTADDGFANGVGPAKTLDLVTRLPNRVPVVTPTAATQSVGVGSSVAVSTLFSVNDADGDTPAQYNFWDGGAGGGQFRVNGIGQNSGQNINVASLTNVTYAAGATQGSEILYVQAYDGVAWSPWVNWTMQTQRSSNVLPVVSAPVTKNADASQWYKLSDFITVSDADGDPMVRFEIGDATSTAGSGLIYANGATQAQGVTVTVNASNLSSVWVQGGQNTGHDTITVRANDGFGWSNTASFDLNTRLPNRAPVVTPTAGAQGLGLGTTVAASTLFRVSDADGDAITQYKFWDGGAGGGQFRVNGTGQISNGEIVVSAANLANTVYAAGSTQGSETLYMQAYDGTAWSAWQSWTEESFALIRFSEVIGSSGADSHFGSPNSIYFGLQGNDLLTSSISSSATQRDPLFVGGAGSDTYRINFGGAATVFENGNSTQDRLEIFSFGLNRSTSLIGTIDGGRHLFLGDSASQSGVILMDWRAPENRIEEFSLSSGLYSYDQFNAALNWNVVPDIAWSSFGESRLAVNESIAYYAQRAATLAGPP